MVQNSSFKNIFYQPEIADGVHRLDAEESRHCIKVLRRSVGDHIRLTDGKGKFYTARIQEASPTQCVFEIEEVIPIARNPYAIHIAIAPTKNAERIEWFVEKAVELGIDSITLVNCKNSERTYQKIERLHKVAVSAMKQSLKAFLPAINPLSELQAVIENTTAQGRYIAYVDASNPDHLKSVAKPGQDYLVLIGPEGDFDDVELNLALYHGFTKVSLGPSRLRTETAGLAACHILNLLNN